MSLQNIHDHIEQNFDAHVSRLQEFVRQRSISPQNVGIAETAELVARYLDDLGCHTTEIVRTPGNPIVLGQYDAGAEKTLIVYLMYDTMPVDGEAWTVEPFAGTLRDHPEYGQCLVARGAINSKGPMMAFFNTLDSIKDVDGQLPVNLIFVVEGEEELGSKSLPGFVDKHLDLLKTADGCFMPLSHQATDGSVDLSFGVKGILYLELECSGALWGKGPTQYDIHSSSKAVVDSPAWRMVQALSTMVSPDGNKVLIEGFYDEVAPPSEQDKKLLDDLAVTFDPDQLSILMTGVHKYMFDPANAREFLERYLFQPTLNIDGIWGGYIGEGQKTVLPHKVMVKMDARHVPNMDTAKTLARLRKHLDDRGFTDIVIHEHSQVKWAKTDPNSDLARAMISSLKEFDFPVQIWPHAPGTGPWHLFGGSPLNIPCAIGGLGHGGRAHSPDEYFVMRGKGTVAGMDLAEKHFATLLYRYAGK